MRVAIIGQQAFGAGVLEAFRARGDAIVGVFCAPEKPGTKPDALRQAAELHGIKVFQLPALGGPQAEQALRALDADLAVMAYVLQFAPQTFVNIPRHGTIQYHPSLLPRYRGPSSINWPVIKGDTRTGVTIFRPTDGLDEGPIVLQRTVDIRPHDTVGTLYFERLFPLGVQAIVEAAELIAAGRHQERVQDEALATYEGWCRDNESEINWHGHVDCVYNLVRGCDPSPGAWTVVNERRIRVFDVRKHSARRYDDVAGKPGEIVAIGAQSMHVALQGGTLEIFKVRAEGVEKMAAGAFALTAGLKPGHRLGRRHEPQATAAGHPRSTARQPQTA
jgi:methionyl-tRNA formyltransferase